MQIQHFYDPITYTLTYIVFDPDTHDAVIIDPVLDYEPWSSKISFESLELLKTFISQHNLNVHYILETHAHADHLSSSQYLKQALPKAQLAIGEKITAVQSIFKTVFNADTLSTDGSQFDRLIQDGETIEAGSLTFHALHTPGHTPACMSYLIEDVVFTGDALFIEDYGTGRCDFPGGSAEDSYHSVHDRLYQLPDQTRVFVGHDYQPGGRELRYETTIGASKQANIYLKADTPKEQFVSQRQNRDQNLAAPKLLLPSVQININAGHLPPVESNGMAYLKIPLR